MQMSTHFSEAIFLVEAPTGCILLEDIKLKEVSNTSSVVHQLSPQLRYLDTGYKAIKVPALTYLHVRRERRRENRGGCTRRRSRATNFTSTQKGAGGSVD